MNLIIKLKKKMRILLHNLIEWLEDLEDYREIKKAKKSGEFEKTTDFEKFIKTLKL